MTCDKEEVPPFFSVIMPTYNRQELLDEAVRSVINQLEEDWELIVVDDARREQGILCCRKCRP